MKTFSTLLIYILLPFLFFSTCKNEPRIDTSGIATDSLSIAAGKNLFNQTCASCHSFNQTGIGPPLGGLTGEVSSDWIKAFVHNPKKVIDAGDSRAKGLFEKYKAYMTPFPNLADSSLNQIIAYMHKQPKPAFITAGDTAQALINPIPDTILMSNLVIDLKLMMQFPASDTNKKLLTRITKMDIEPHSKDLYVLDLRGKMYKVKGKTASVYFDITKEKPKFMEHPGLATGFGSFAFHPEFFKNGLLYTSYSEPPASAKADYGYPDSIPVAVQWVLTEWKTDHPTAPTFKGTSREILRIDMQSVIHGMQEIIFNPFSKPGSEDYGLMYIGVGDGGSVEHGYPQLAHHLDKIWGNVLRIDPRGKSAQATASTNGQYGIPNTNPFVAIKDSQALGEIYARGFRNPHRITWTTAGDMLVSNVGHANIETLNHILPGHDYGWPVTEGPFRINIKGDMKKIYALPVEYNKYHFTNPLAMYDHDEGLAICGGYEYTGTSIEQLKGKFIFGDIVRGRVFYINTADIKTGKMLPIEESRITLDGKPTSLKDICQCTKVDMHYGRDARGDIYILTKPDGKLYKMVNASLLQ